MFLDTPTHTLEDGELQLVGVLVSNYVETKVTWFEFYYGRLLPWMCVHAKSVERHSVELW